MAIRLSYRSVFVSDLHLGSSSARAADAAAFLHHVECDHLYLVGDIIDMWRLRRRWHWPEEHNRVVRRILKLAHRGTNVCFIPGNHDEAARHYIGLHFGGVQIAPHAFHVTADARRLFVTHGDQFDLVVRHHRLLSVAGSLAYDNLVILSRHYNTLRRAAGLPYWSLSQYLKLKVKSACTHIARFEETLVAEAQRTGCDGVVCGHIHKAEIRHGPISYYNCGDWVESCTALVEHHDGTLQIVRGNSLVEQLMPPAVCEPIPSIAGRAPPPPASPPTGAPSSAAATTRRTTASPGSPPSATPAAPTSTATAPPTPRISSTS